MFQLFFVKTFTFSKKTIAKQLKSMDVDLRKMPLGKISKRQILQGYKVLTAIEKALQADSVSRAKLADLSTRFSVACAVVSGSGLSSRL